ncbi:MAG: HAMP domain-containing sensor histidine kinase [Parasphingorhabdus sp.]|uniref:sensor histidine kinase n=1 Tax=Parasphingorhabdus sp. TaxID=2709688 RepID=UPI00300351BF
MSNFPRIFKPRSMRELALLYSVCFMIATAILGFAVYSSARDALQQQLDSRIMAETNDLLSVYKSDGMTALSDEIVRHEEQGGITQMGYILTDNEGTRVAGKMQAKTPKTGWSIINFVDEDEGTDQARAYTIALSNGGRLVVIADQEAIEEIGEVLTQQFLMAFAAIFLIGVGGSVVLTRLLRRRLSGINETASAIIGGDLNQRISLDGSRGEFDRLSQTLNAMLDRISDLMENLRQVSGDIAHDLRSPLNRLRQNLETSLSEKLEPAEQRSAVEGAIVQADEMLDMFSALLGISEIEGGHIKSTFKPQRLDRIVAEICEAYQPAAHDAGFDMQCEIEPDCIVTGNRHLLGQMLTNLLDNSLRHAPEGSQILVQITENLEEIDLVVSDNGPGIPEERQQEMLRRFARMEESRTTSGNGLGLSLVKAISDVHGAQLALSDNQPGLKVTISFGLKTNL